MYAAREKNSGSPRNSRFSEKDALESLLGDDEQSVDKRLLIEHTGMMIFFEFPAAKLQRS
jgi:hypothetical protein